MYTVKKSFNLTLTFTVKLKILKEEKCIDLFFLK